VRELGLAFFWNDELGIGVIANLDELPVLVILSLLS
jgi:hypothetical protein